MDDSNCFGSGLAIAQDDIAAGGTGCVAYPFELQVGENICQFTIAILRDTPGIEQIVTSCQDDVSYFDGRSPPFLVEINCIGWAEFLAGFAGTLSDSRCN